MAPGKCHQRMAELRRQAAWLGILSFGTHRIQVLLVQLPHRSHAYAYLTCSAHKCNVGSGDVAEEEVMYTLFNLAQFLGFVEVVRREGPREDAFLQAGNPQGSDTLATLVEGLRFVMSAASGNLVVSVQRQPCINAYYQQPLV